MLAVVWRVMGKAFDVDAFVDDFALRPDCVWRVGEPLPGRNGSHLESGFSFSVDRDDDDLEHAMDDVRWFLRARRAALEAVPKRGGASTLDIGIAVGDDQHYTRSIRIPPDLLRELALADVVLEITAYPSSGDEEPNPRS